MCWERTFSFPVNDRSLLRQAVFLAGPTSVGKSDIALDLAARHRGEIVCADAFQLYRDFPVLSAQPTAADKARVPHHLFGSVPCMEEMDAARFAMCALGVIEEIVARGRVPFVVGGSGLYLQALTAGLPQLPPIDPSIRENVRTMTPKDMVARLRELDPASLTIIDIHNPRRVARRLELSLQTGRPASEVLTEPPAPAGLRGVVLTRERDDLKARIGTAVAARFAGGAVEEVRAARASAGGTARQILGWREISALLDGEMDRAACVELVTTATRQYAKRQLTWFRAKSNFPAENLSTVTPDHLDRIARRLGLP
jgi:tRNA dimethylallyltransferase